MNEELKPCPFCGGAEAKLTKCHAEWGYGWHVTCNNCLSVGETAYSDRTGMTAKTPEEKGREMKAHAVANWNRRAPSDHVGDATNMVDDNPPLTLEEVREHIRNGHPNEIAPLYVVFFPTMPIEYASRWRDAYNLSQLIAPPCPTYGKTWLAYRRKPEEGER